MKYPFYLLFISIFFYSCDTTNQYDVYVENQTGGQIEIAYKSLVDKRGVHEDRMILGDKERVLIVSTKNLDKDYLFQPPSNDQCAKVLEYLEAIMQDTLVNNKKWCSEDVQVQHTDIGQGEFMVKYKLENFE